MFVFCREFAVVDVRRADAFVDVLGGEVVAQHPCGARVAVLATHPVVKGAAALVEGLDEGGVRARKLGLPPAVVVIVRIEVAGFGVDVVGKRGVGDSHVFLHLAVREGELHDERAAAVNEGAGEDEQRVGVPRLGGVVGERGVDGDGQPAEGDGAVTQPGGSHVGEGEGHQQHGDDVGDGVVEGELHGERGGSKGGEDDAEVVDAPAQAIVEVGEAAGDNAEDERHGVMRDVERPDDEGGSADAEDDGQGRDEVGVGQGDFHRTGRWW